MEKMGACSSVKAKIKAASRGLRLARKLGFTKVWLKLDSLIVAGMLEGRYNWCLEHAPMLSGCKKIMKSPSWIIKISHCFL